MSTNKSMHKDVPMDIKTAINLNRAPIIPEIIKPLIESAKIELMKLISKNKWNVCDKTINDLLNHYEQIVAQLTNTVLIQRFSSYHLVQNPLWRPKTALPGFATEKKPRDVLDAYIYWEEGERIFASDGPYPELARLILIARSNWLNNAEELLSRVYKNYTDITEVIGVNPNELGTITSIHFGISDPHNHGRTVAILSFNNRKIVYKPRTLDAELAWNYIVEKVMKACLPGETVCLPKVKSYSEFGFMEYVNVSECENDLSVKRCYFRYGLLMAVAHALGTCDLHHENVIVASEYPIVVDSETLFRSRLATSEFGNSHLKIEQNLNMADIEIRESVLELGILPIIMTSPIKGNELEEQEIEIGSLCAFAHKSFNDMVPCAQGTDDVHLELLKVVAKDFPNLPSCNGEPKFPKQYLKEITDGFCCAHKYIRQHKEDFLMNGGILDKFAKCPIRLLARPTLDYMSIFIRSLSPQVLHSNKLRRDLISSDLKTVGKYRMDTVNELLPIEIENILNGDIPLFELNSDQESYAEAKLYASPLECAKTRLNSMDEFDCLLQVTQIREQLLRKDQDIIKSKPSTPEHQAIIKHTLDIFDAIAKSSIVVENNSYWVNASFAPGFQSIMAHIDRESLYDGTVGISLALAEAAKVSKCDDWMRIAIKAVNPILKQCNLKSVRRGGGMANGLGGVIYSLTRIASISGKEELLDAALHIAIKNGKHIADTDTLNEVLYGSAGLLLSLIALYNKKILPELLNVMDHIATKIISQATISEHQAYWKTSSGKTMPHVSHGSSGIAMALSRWARLRGDKNAAEISLKAICHDDAFWIEQEQGWADGRFQDIELNEKTNWSWCNGRAGALLSRLAVSEALNVPFLSDNVSKALTAKKTDVLTEITPGLCCGTPGVLDALLKIEAVYNHPNIAQCTEQAINLLATKSSLNHHSMLTPSLFNGTAGLAFSLLRASYPMTVDSILWFE